MVSRLFVHVLVTAVCTRMLNSSPKGTRKLCSMCVVNSMEYHFVRVWYSGQGKLQSILLLAPLPVGSTNENLTCSLHSFLMRWLFTISQRAFGCARGYRTAATAHGPSILQINAIASDRSEDMRQPPGPTDGVSPEVLLPEQGSTCSSSSTVDVHAGNGHEEQQRGDE